MTRDQGITDLRDAFGPISEHTLPGEPGVVLVVVDTPQAVTGTDIATRLAFKLPDPIEGRPTHFVEPHVHLRTGGEPNNSAVQELAGSLWKTWSLATEWKPDRHDLSQLGFTVLSVWDR